MFFGAGSRDAAVPWATVEKAYKEDKSGLPKVFAVIKGANHHECSSGPDRWEPYVVSMFNCHIHGDHEDCENVYGTSTEKPCSLCTCPDTIPMTKCIHENEPANTTAFLLPLI